MNLDANLNHRSSKNGIVSKQLPISEELVGNATLEGFGTIQTLDWCWKWNKELLTGLDTRTIDLNSNMDWWLQVYLMTYTKK